MGTRNLTVVQLGGEYKIAQYGQWDGYPEGQGRTILDFLVGTGNNEKLKSALDRCRYIEPEGRDKEFLAEYNRRAPKWWDDLDNRSAEQRHWFFTYISRDLGAKILANVAYSDDEEILLKDSLNFAGDSLMCEFAYVIDLDQNTLEVFKGFNEIPLGEGERFKDVNAGEAASGKWRPVRMAAKYALSALPSIEQMVADCGDCDRDYL